MDTASLPLTKVVLFSSGVGFFEHAGDLYKRYVAKFNEQEDQIEKHRAEIAQGQEKEVELRKALEEHVTALELE